MRKKLFFLAMALFCIQTQYLFAQKNYLDPKRIQRQSITTFVAGKKIQTGQLNQMLRNHRALQKTKPQPVLSGGTKTNWKKNDHVFVPLLILTIPGIIGIILLYLSKKGRS